MRLMLFFLLSFNFLLAQSWQEKIEDPTNFYSVRKAYLEDRIAKGLSSDKKLEFDGEDDETQFRRWEHMIEPRVYPSGKLPPACYLLDEYYKFFSNRYEFDTLRKADWRLIEYDEGFPANGYSGRLNCIAFHPTDTNIIYVGAPSGGLWKTTNGGTYWTSLTDYLPSLGVSEIVIDYTNPNIMYMATGDRDGAFFISNPYSYGLLKSTDGGNSWLETGLKHIFEDQMTIQRLIMHPTNHNILLAAVTGTNGNLRGIWRSSDGGTSWKNVAGGGKFDVEFNPGDPNIVYCVGWKNLARSTDAGLTWNVINSPVLPYTETTWAKISVTPANPHMLIAQFLNPNNGYTHSLYKSWDDGLTWTKINSDAVPTQATYDWVLTVSPNDTNIVFWGGQQLYGSVDGGISRFIYPCGHVDHHDLVYRPGSNVLYNCNDGGLYKSYDDGNKWINLNKSLHTFQYYRIGSSQNNKDFILTGAQDNGTQKHNLPNWMTIGMFADGMENIVDYSDDNIYYASYQYGLMTRFGTGMGTFYNPPSAGSSTYYAWVTPMVIHPKNPNILFVGAKDIYKTTSRGNQWTAISNQLTVKDGVGGGMLRTMAVSESNPDSIIYAASYVVVYKTTNGGAIWSDITSGLPGNAGPFTGSAISWVCIHPDNPNTAWITMSGYSKGNKVFRTYDGGASWKNISDNLPAIPVNCIVYQKYNNDALYIATDFGVFYRDSTMTQWIPFMTNLPNVPVQELEIHYGKGTLRAATFGRGLWESPLFGSVLDVETSSNDGIQISPNPASDYIEISGSSVILSEAKNLVVSIYDVLGVEVYCSITTPPFTSHCDVHPTQEGGKYRVDISGLAPGVYFVRVGDVVRKFMKM